MLERVFNYLLLIYLISGYNKVSDKISGRFTKSISSSKYLGSKDKEEVFFCESCGTEHINWVGRCNSCKEWNTVKQFKVPKLVSSINSKSFPKLEKNRINTDQGFLTQKETLIPLSSVDTNVAASRIKVWSSELNRVLGGGLVKGSVILLTGEPGIGKSTLLLQLSTSIASISPLSSVVYISGEETKEQVASRADRLKLGTNNLYVVCNGDIESALSEVLNMNPLPALVIIDSIQTMYLDSFQSSIGSVLQVRETTSTLVRFAKSSGSTVLITGHVTKSGDIAGPKLLEHMVDCVLYLEGNAESDYRLLRGVKNRFGSTSEIGVYCMEANGLIDVLNPSELFMSRAVFNEGLNGAAILILMEGSRPLLAEVQCLVGEYSAFKTPRRTSDGYPIQRLFLLCAVLEKKLGITLSSREVFLNVVGGLKVNDPDSDLAVSIAIISSYSNRIVCPNTVFLGELGLNGEVRGGKGIIAKSQEAFKMGFKKIIVPKQSLSSSKNKFPVDVGFKYDDILPVVDLEEALKIAFGCENLNFLKKFKGDVKTV